MKKNLKKGFSLVELLVAMAIIAVLISIAAYGIQIVQRNARNTKRRKIVEDLQLTIADIQTNKFEYPSAMAVDGKSIIFSDTGGAKMGTPYEIKGFTIIEIVACPNSSAESIAGGGETQQNRVAVCYNANNLTVGVRLEGNDDGYVTDV